jgi:hypothetical protein
MKTEQKPENNKIINSINTFSRNCLHFPKDRKGSNLKNDPSI